MSDREHDVRWNGPTFWSVFVSITAIVVVLSAALNYVVDPFDLYDNTFFPPSRLNNYQTKLDLYRNSQPAPEALILGSSRVMTCDPEIVEELTGENCFNFWLPGSAAETYYAVMKLVLEENEAPIEVIIVGVGVETIHPALPIQPEARFIPEISQYFIYDTDGQASAFELVALLFTMDQTIQSAAVIRSILRKSGDEETLQAGQPTLDNRDDGFSLQAHAEAQIAAGTFDLDAKIEARLRRKRYTERGLTVSGWAGPSETRMAYWEDFLALCGENGTRVYAFMTPAHPRLWSLLQEFDVEPVYSEVADYFERTVSEKGGVFRDYTLLDSFGGDPELFYDEMHLQPRNSGTLLRRLLTGNGIGETGEVE